MNVMTTTSSLSFANYWDHFLARIGVRRRGHHVEPGLYALGRPTPDSPVFVTAHYTLSFDALRSALSGIDGFILALDTKGINVWCAAGKGTFGTEELVRRIEETGLKEMVRQRTLILPQLGAAGVSAHEVKKRTGFEVEYGPVRAADLPAYLESRRATPEMRRVTFNLRDRLILIPVEIFRIILPVLVILAVIWALSGGQIVDRFLRSPGLAIILFSGMILFPILLPWIPTPDFSTKGFLLGGIVALAFSLIKLLSYYPDLGTGRMMAEVISDILIWSPPIAYLALAFTGSTTFTSRSGVRREIFRYIPIMAYMFGFGIVLELILKLT